MSYCIYNSNRIIPAPPSVSPQKVYQKTGDGKIIGAGFTITINGTLLPDKGSPRTDGSFWNLPGYPPDETIPDESRLAAILRKQEALRKLFATEGYLFEIQSGDGTPAMKFSPRIVSLDFLDNETRWYNRCDYTLVLECDVIYVNGQLISEDQFAEFISDASENWSFEVDETPEGIDMPRTYRVTHSISATGKRFYNENGGLVKQAWEQARDYVLPKLGISNFFASSSGVNNLPDYYRGFNYVRANNQDDTAGQYSVTESWLLASGAALEEFTCDIRNSQDTGVTQVTLAGSINGLEERDSNMNLIRKKYTNGLAKWGQVAPAIFTRAQNYAGITLNPVTLSRQVGKNDINGTISYSYEYDNRPTNLFSGMNYESIRINTVFAGDLFASIPIIGRANGNLLQDLSGKTENSVTLSIELVTQPPSFGDGSISALSNAFFRNPRVAQANTFNNLIQAARPSLNFNATKEFNREPSEDWDVKTGRYNYSIQWVFGY